MALKYRLWKCDEKWVKSFCDARGISILVENIDNTLEVSPRTHVEASILYELLSCIELAVQKGGLIKLICTRSTIDAIMMTVDFKYKALAIKALQLLDFIICRKEDEVFNESDPENKPVQIDSFWNIGLAIKHLAYASSQAPFQKFANAIHNPHLDIDAKVSLFTFVNDLIRLERNQEVRFRIRDRLRVS